MRILTAAIGVTFFVIASSNAYAQDLTVDQLPKLSQALLDAVGSGDKAVFERTLADKGLFTDEDGVTRDKAELIAQIGPLPAGISGRIRLIDPKSVLSGNVAVLTYDALEDEIYFGQDLHTRFHTTDVYQVIEGRWQIVSSQTTAVPSEPKAYAPANPVVGLAGDYELTEGKIAHVSIENGKVMWSRAGKPPVELLPLGGDVYFQPGALRGLKIFVRDRSGNAVKLLDRRDNNDINWRRTKSH